MFGAKKITKRIAVAEGEVVMHPATLALVISDEFSRDRKGNVIAVARIAGIMAGERTHELIPLAHPAAADLGRGRDRVRRAHPPDCVSPPRRASPAKTGVEMEALTAVSVACLTIYDMAKATGDRDLEITKVRLVEKRGGRSGTYKRKRGG